MITNKKESLTTMLHYPSQQDNEKVEHPFQKKTTSKWTVEEIIVIVTMPFLYGAATRLPFIYFVIHLTSQFDLDWLTIGLCVACYQGCRVISNIFAIKHPKLSHMLGTSAGLAGYIAVFVVDKNLVLPFVLGTAIVGLSETMSPMQKYVKEIYDKDRKKAQVRIKYQYAFVMIGVVFSFFTGGFVYQYHSINGVAIFGMILESLALVTFFIYSLLLPVKEVKGDSFFFPSTAHSNDEEDEETECKVLVDTSVFPIKYQHTMNEDDLELDKIFVADSDPTAVVAQQERTPEPQKQAEEGENCRFIAFPMTTPRNHSPAASVTNKEEYDDLEMNCPPTMILAAAKASLPPKSNPTDRKGKILLLDVIFQHHPPDDPTVATTEKVPQGEQDGEEEDKEENAGKDASLLVGSGLCIETSPVLLDSSSSHKINLDTLILSANTDYSASDLPATWVNWLLCFTFGIQALTIGYTHGIGPIFLLTQFGAETGAIGVLFSAGSAFGTISAILVTCTSFGNKLLRRIVAPPFDLCFSLGGIAVGAFVTCVPNFAISAVGFILLMAFNDLASTLLTELQASVTTISNYSVLGPSGQIVRRSLNVVTALTGPVLYGIFPRLPYYVTGAITICWAMMLLIMFKFRMKNTSEIISRRVGQPRKSVKRRLSFSTREAVFVSLHTNSEEEQL